MKRYMVFAYEEFYPNGGWDDFIMDTDDLLEASIMAAHQCNKDDDDGYMNFADVVDAQTKQVVFSVTGEYQDTQEEKEERRRNYVPGTTTTANWRVEYVTLNSPGPAS